MAPIGRAVRTRGTRVGVPTRAGGDNAVRYWLVSAGVRIRLARTIALRVVLIEAGGGKLAEFARLNPVANVLGVAGPTFCPGALRHLLFGGGEFFNNEVGATGNIRVFAGS